MVGIANYGLSILLRRFPRPLGKRSADNSKGPLLRNNYLRVFGRSGAVRRSTLPRTATDSLLARPWIGSAGKRRLPPAHFLAERVSRPGGPAGDPEAPAGVTMPAPRRLSSTGERFGGQG